jgi:hypothetical protein
MRAVRLLSLLLCSLPATAFALAWEQLAYVTLSPSNGVVYLAFRPTQEQHSRGLMVFSSKDSAAHRFCVPNLAVWDETKELQCTTSEDSKPQRIYRAVPPDKKLAAEARRIFSLHQKGKKRCDAGDFAGYLYCVKGCEGDLSKLLVSVEYTECVE